MKSEIRAPREDILKFLRSWHMAGEIKSHFGIKDPEAYISELVADGYEIQKEKRAYGMFQVMHYKWSGIWKKVQK